MAVPTPCGFVSVVVFGFVIGLITGVLVSHHRDTDYSHRTNRRN